MTVGLAVPKRFDFAAPEVRKGRLIAAIALTFALPGTVMGIVWTLSEPSPPGPSVRREMEQSVRPGADPSGEEAYFRFLDDGVRRWWTPLGNPQWGNLGTGDPP